LSIYLISLNKNASLKQIEEILEEKFKKKNLNYTLLAREIYSFFYKQPNPSIIIYPWIISGIYFHSIKMNEFEKFLNTIDSLESNGLKIKKIE